MDDDFPSIGKRKRRFPDLENLKRRGRFKGANGTKKISIIAIIILVLGMRLFFYLEFSDISINPSKSNQSLGNANIVKMALVQEALAADSGASLMPDSVTLDPMKKIGISTLPDESGSDKVCKIPKNNKKKEEKKRMEIGGVDIEKMLEGYPIFEMVGQMHKKKKEVAAFLIGIAKKESDWGKHSPRKNGRNCYNYWGYKGSYNLTDSGYSCFDNPEQAIDVVGGKIEELIARNIDTPERMVVWKCGSSCRGHEPGSVKKWISDVSKYYYQLIS